VEVNIESVGRFGASVIFPDVGFKGELNIRDIIWGYCERLSDHLHSGQMVRVKCLAYNAGSDSIQVGIKQLEQNEFTLFQQQHDSTKALWCEVIGMTGQSVRVRIGFGTHQTFGYIHRSEASSLLFVDDALAKHLFRVGDFYHCRVKRFDAENSLVELSRKAYLVAELQNLRYDGGAFGARIAYAKGGAFAYGDKVEGRIVDGIDRNRKQPTNVDVMIVRKGNSARDVEVSVT
jgi:ribosomal protein S1